LSKKLPGIYDWGKQQHQNNDCSRLEFLKQYLHETFFFRQLPWKPFACLCKAREFVERIKAKDPNLRIAAMIYEIEEIHET
jgi:hypothetical protein